MTSSAAGEWARAINSLAIKACLTALVLIIDAVF
jgi:hypothetical protein